MVHRDVEQDPGRIQQPGIRFKLNRYCHRSAYLLGFFSSPELNSRDFCNRMDIAYFLDRIQFDLHLHAQAYRLYIEAALIAVIFYAGFTDFRSFKIRNNVLLLLLLLYVLFALVARTWPEILSNVIFSTIMSAVLVLFYTRGVIGGGDVKLIAIVCLWIGVHCALLFAILLPLFVALHVFAAWLGWADTKPMAGRFAIPYAPSVAGALIVTVMFGCL